MTDEPTAWKEPAITINGQRLDTGQAMTARVAIYDFYMQLSDPKHRGYNDPIFIAYRTRLVELMRLMTTD